MPPSAASSCSTWPARWRWPRECARLLLTDPGRLRRGGDRLDEVADLLLVEVRGDVGLADDPDEALAVDHREAAHLVRRHRVQGLLDRVVGADRDGLAVADPELARAHV